MRSWKKLKCSGEIPPQRSRHSGVVHGNLLYVFGGTDDNGKMNDLRKLNLTTFEWKKVENKGNAPSKRSGHSACIVNNCMIIFGGYDMQSCSDIHLFSFKTATWDKILPIGDIPSKRNHHSATGYEDSMYVFGGHGWNGISNVFYNDVYEFKLTNQKWTKIETSGDIPLKRYDHSSVVYKKHMYIFGGEDKSFMNDLLKLNLKTFEWKLIEASGDIPTKRSGHKSTVNVLGQTLMVFGGYDGSYCNDLYSFNFVNQIWTKIKTNGDVPLKRYDHVVISNNESLFIFGGNCEHSLSNEVYEYNFGNPNSIFLFKNLIENENYSDCILISNEKKKFFCHKFLISQSEYLNDILLKNEEETINTSEEEEIKDKKILEIQLDLTNEILSEVRNFLIKQKKKILYYLYSGNIFPIGKTKEKTEYSLYVNLIKGSKELQLTSLYYLYLSQFDLIISIENVLNILILSEKYELKMLKKLCIHFFKQHKKEIKKESVLKLDKEIIYDLFNESEEEDENIINNFLNQNSNDLENHILKLYETKNYCDVYLISSDLVKFKCHKGILSNSCEYFEIMFSGLFEESFKNEIFLNDDLDSITLEYILNFIYTRDLGLVGDHLILINLLKFSDFSLMKNLFELALDQLISLVNIGNALEISQSCVEFENSDDTRLKDKCMNVIKSTSKEELVEIIFTQQEYQKNLKDQIKKQHNFISKKEHENILEKVKLEYEEKIQNLIKNNKLNFNNVKKEQEEIINLTSPNDNSNSDESENEKSPLIIGKDEELIEKQNRNKIEQEEEDIKEKED